MKSDREFLDGIYKKLARDEHLQNNKDLSTLNIESTIENTAIHFSSECDLLHEEDKGKQEDAYQGDIFKNKAKVTLA